MTNICIRSLIYTLPRIHILPSRIQNLLHSIRVLERFLFHIENSLRSWEKRNWGKKMRKATKWRNAKRTFSLFFLLNSDRNEISVGIKRDWRWVMHEKRNLLCFDDARNSVSWSKSFKFAPNLRHGVFSPNYNKVF
jgi:hypothetical protein